jgi:hypothetical protein
MAAAPSGAVITMDRTAIVKTYNKEWSAFNILDYFKVI